MIGIISQDEISVVGHSLFKNFRIALSNYVQTSFVDINSVDSLHDITTLIIVDEHYGPHRQVWQNDFFINSVNEKGIAVLIFNFEKIFNSQFPWNIEIQNSVEKFRKRKQIVSDINDALILNADVINKQFLSRDTILPALDQNKIDDILFIGQVNEYYPTRSNLLDELQKVNSRVTINRTDRKYTYEEFITILNQSKFILNPLGTGEFINLRFYEALKLNSIVIQQYTEGMEKWYPELNHPNVLKFKTVEEFAQLNFNIDAVNEQMYLEDYFEEIDLKNIIDNI